MNSRSYRNYLLLAAAVIVAGCHGASGPRVEKTIAREWPASAITRLEVREVAGDLSIAAGGSDRILLVAHVRARGVKPQPGRENDGWFETVVTGNTLTIEREERRQGKWRFGGPEVEIDYELQVPAHIDLDLTTVNGRIVTRGTEGETELTTVNGRIDSETAGTKEFSARTVNGSVRAAFIRDFQGAQVKTVNGEVEAILPQSASFAVDLSQVNGDFEASFPLSIHSHPGSRRVSGEVNGGRHELKIVTVNGDVEVMGPAPEAPQAPEAPAAPVVPLPPPPATPAVPAAPTT